MQKFEGTGKKFSNLISFFRHCFAVMCAQKIWHGFVYIFTSRVLCIMNSHVMECHTHGSRQHGRDYFSSSQICVIVATTVIWMRFCVMASGANACDSKHKRKPFFLFNGNWKLTQSNIMKNVQIVYCALSRTSACPSGSDIQGKHIYIRNPNMCR